MLRNRIMLRSLFGETMELVFLYSISRTRILLETFVYSLSAFISLFND
jgi:hypothetical protein